MSGFQIGHQWSPTVFLDLEVSNHTDTKCVTINRHELCSTIHYCPLAAYQCNYVDETGDTGYYCGFSSPLCSCSATWGLYDCDCYVTPDTPYWVVTNVKCTSPSPYLEVDPNGADCSDRVGDICVSGYNVFDILNEDNDRGIFQVTWQCPKESTEDRSACTCAALQSYEECSSCKVCGDGEIGDFALECNGFSLDSRPFWLH